HIVVRVSKKSELERTSLGVIANGLGLRRKGNVVVRNTQFFASEIMNLHARITVDGPGSELCLPTISVRFATFNSQQYFHEEYLQLPHSNGGRTQEAPHSPAIAHRGKAAYLVKLGKVEVRHRHRWRWRRLKDRNAEHMARRCPVRVHPTDLHIERHRRVRRRHRGNDLRGIVVRRWCQRHERIVHSKAWSRLQRTPGRQ